MSLWKIFWIFGRPFGNVRADFSRSRRHGCISAGRVRDRFAPRGPGDVGGTFSVESLDVCQIYEVRLESLQVVLRFLDPASHLRICFYLTRRVTRALESICARFQIFLVSDKTFQIQGLHFLCDNFLTKA